MKGKIKFILGLVVVLFLMIMAALHIESDSIWAWIVSYAVLGGFCFRKIYGLIKGK
jgi:hypothetical protein